MSMLTVRNLDPHVKEKIQERAARHGRSMEAEVREILAAAVEGVDEERTFGAVIEEALKGLPPVDVPDFGLDRQLPRGVEF